MWVGSIESNQKTQKWNIFEMSDRICKLKENLEVRGGTHPKYKIKYEEKVFDHRTDKGEVLVVSRCASAFSSHGDKCQKRAWIKCQ